MRRRPGPLRKPLAKPYVKAELSNSCYPRLLREVVLIDHADELIVNGLTSPIVLNGVELQATLKLLMPFLDGQTSVAELVGRVRTVDEVKIIQALNELTRLGVVTLAHDRIEQPCNSDQQTAAYLWRTAASVPALVSAPIALRRLHESQISIWCRRGFHDILMLSLRTSSFKHVNVEILDEAITALLPSVRSGTSLVVIIDDGLWSSKQLSYLDNACAQYGVRWLHVRMADDRLIMGPLFSRGLLPCYECFAATFANNSPVSRKPVSPSLATLAAGVLATELVHLSAGIGRLLSGDGHTILTPYGEIAERSRVSMRLDCTQCQSGSEQLFDQCMRTTTVRQVYAFEQKVQTSDRDLSSRAVTAASIPFVISSRRFTNSRRIRLARLLPELGTGMLGGLYGRFPQGRKPQLRDIANIMMLTAGVRPHRSEAIGHVKRWCASGGNLGSIQPCILVRDVEGIYPGMYLYDAETHELIVSDHEVRIPSVFQCYSRSQESELPYAVVALVGCFGRVRNKYGDFGYRLMHMDTGSAVGQLCCVASALGIFAQLESEWNANELTSALRLSDNEEVTQLISLRAEKVSQQPMAKPVQHSHATTAPVSEEWIRMGSGDLLRLLRNTPESETRSFCGVPDKVLVDTAHTVTLPQERSFGRTVGEILRERRSVRTFSPKELSLGDLATMLTAAQRADAEDWQNIERGRPGLSCKLIIRRVSGVTPGVYQYDPKCNGLQFQQLLPTEDECRELFVQEELACAPITVWIEGDLINAVATRGFHGYNQMLVRAGCYTTRLWFAAMAVGLQGVLVAGLVHGQARLKIKVGTQGYSSLLALVCGYDGTLRAQRLLQEEV